MRGQEGGLLPWHGLACVGGQGGYSECNPGGCGGEAVRGCAGCDAVQRHGDLDGRDPRAAR